VDSRSDHYHRRLNRSLTWYTWTLNAGSGLSGAYLAGVQKSEATAYGWASLKHDVHEN
jgi:hypothetical protein